MEYVFQDKLKYSRSARTYSGFLEIKGQRIEFSVNPPSVDSNLVYAEECLRGLGERWDEVWRRVVDASLTAAQASGLFSAHDDAGANTVQLENITTHLNIEAEMEFLLKVGLVGQLPDGECVEIRLSSSGDLMSASMRSVS